MTQIGHPVGQVADAGAKITQKTFDVCFKGIETSFDAVEVNSIFEVETIDDNFNVTFDFAFDGSAAFDDGLKFFLQRFVLGQGFSSLVDSLLT